MNSLLQLKTSIRADIWASSEAENLVTAHNNAVLEALSQLQKYVPCFRNHHANVTQFCNTFFKCGMTVLAAPPGVIKWVYTLANDDWCDPVVYRQATLVEVECFRDPCRTYEDPANEGEPVLPMGFKKAEATTDSDWGRARCGLFAIHDGRLYLTPWIQSNETVVVEWSGEKSVVDWTDEDPVSDAIDFRKAVKLYVQFAHERDYGDEARAERFHNRLNTGHFDEALSDLILRCAEETKLQDDTACRPCPTWAQITDDVAPA